MVLNRRRTVALSYMLVACGGDDGGATHAPAVGCNVGIRHPSYDFPQLLAMNQRGLGYARLEPTLMREAGHMGRLPAVVRAH